MIVRFIFRMGRAIIKVKTEVKSIENQSKDRYDFHGCFKPRPTIYSKIFEWIEGHGFRGPSKIPSKINEHAINGSLIPLNYTSQPAE